MDAEKHQESNELTAQEVRCVVDVLDVLVAMDINLKAERIKDEKSIL